MYTQNPRPAPAPVHELNPQPQPEQRQDGVVGSPPPNTIIVTFPERGSLAEIAATASSPARVSESAGGRAANRIGAAVSYLSEPDSGASLVVAGSGLAVVAYLWSAIIL